MTFEFPRVWYPVDFYFGIGRSQKRILHVPERVVSLGAESLGTNRKTLILKVHFIVHLTLIIDLQLSRTLN